MVQPVQADHLCVCVRVRVCVCVCVCVRVGGGGGDGDALRSDAVKDVVWYMNQLNHHQTTHTEKSINHMSIFQ